MLSINVKKYVKNDILSARVYSLPVFITTTFLLKISVGQFTCMFIYTQTNVKQQ